MKEIIFLITLISTGVSNAKPCLSISGGGVRSLMAPFLLPHPYNDPTKYSLVGGISGGAWGGYLFSKGLTKEFNTYMEDDGFYGFQFSVGGVLTKMADRFKSLFNKINGWPEGLSGLNPDAKFYSEKHLNMWKEAFMSMLNKIDKHNAAFKTPLVVYYASNTGEKFCNGVSICEVMNGVRKCGHGSENENIERSLMISSSAPTTHFVPYMLQFLKLHEGNRYYFDLGVCINNPISFLTNNPKCDSVLNLDFGEDSDDQVLFKMDSVSDLEFLVDGRFESSSKISYFENNKWGVRFKSKGKKILSLRMFSKDFGRMIMYQPDRYLETTINKWVPDQFHDKLKARLFGDQVSTFWGDHLETFKDFF